MGTSSAESVDCLRQKIDDEINSLQASIVALKFRRNALAPISRLSPETLAEIFSLLPSSLWNQEFGHLERIRVAHVCSRWRGIALNQPRLWSHINLDNLTPAGVDGIFAWAKMAPLRLEANITGANKELFGVFKPIRDPHLPYPPPQHLWTFHVGGTRIVCSHPRIPLFVTVRKFQGPGRSALQYFQRHHPQPHKPRA